MHSLIFSLVVGFLLPLQSLSTKSADRSHYLRGKTSFFKRDGVEHTIFEHEATNTTMDFVTNSGICETTAGVDQYSGYLTVGEDQHMWFWFFASRHNASTAPLSTWFNGGPGASSMVGLFEEHGPCQFYNGEKEPSLNPYSWNEFANMLYIDQPINAGFSYGNSTVNSTVTAAPYVWKFLQAFYAYFPQYKNHDFGIFGQSMAGHYIPEFAYYFQSQNEAIVKGHAVGFEIPLIAVGINNGWYDPIIQFKSYIDYSYENPYRQLINESEYNHYLKIYYEVCLPALTDCATSGADEDCSFAQKTCYREVELRIINKDTVDFDPYDIRAPHNDPNPPGTYREYLADPDIVKKIGARTKYKQQNDDIYYTFLDTGDISRSFLSQLTSVVQSGITTLIWAGDADYICAYIGSLLVMNAINYTGSATFNAKTEQNYTVDGKVAGTYKTVDNLSWFRVFNAGHSATYYQPAAALQVFKQTMLKNAISST